MSIKYAITFKNMINVYKIVRYSQIEKFMPSIVLTKSFNLIPMLKKSTEFFQSLRIFSAVFVQIFEKVIWEHWLLHTYFNKSRKKVIYFINYYFSKSCKKVILFINYCWMPHFPYCINNGIFTIELH